MTPNISKAYELALRFDATRGGGILNDGSIKEEVEEGVGEYLADVKRFNEIIDLLAVVLDSGDVVSQDKHLVELEVYAMNLQTTFGNLSDELVKLVKAYAYLNER